MRYTKSTLKKCSICGQEMAARGIGPHMRMKHQLRIVTKVREVMPDLSESKTTHLSDFTKVTETIKELTAVKTAGAGGKIIKSYGPDEPYMIEVDLSNWLYPDIAIKLRFADEWVYENWVMKHKLEGKVEGKRFYSDPTWEVYIRLAVGRQRVELTHDEIVEAIRNSAGSAEEQPVGHDRRGDA